MNHESHNHCNTKNFNQTYGAVGKFTLPGGMYDRRDDRRYHRHARWICATYYGHSSISLSFISGYTASIIPLVRAKLSLIKSLKLVFAADTLSILSMTVVDNIIMLIIPGAMDKNLAHPIYWVSRLICMLAAFAVSYPVNLYLLRRGKGHALTHHYHHM